MDSIAYAPKITTSVKLHSRDTQKNINSEKWPEKKLAAGKMALRMSQLGAVYTKRAERIAGCAGALQTRSCPDGHHNRVVRAVLCKDRACPVCAWRRSRALGARAAAAMAAAGGRYIMISLTIPHVLPLKNGLKLLCKAAGNLMRSPRLRGIVGGYIRTVEITQGRNGWHPHVHILARVEESYFRSALYVLETEWAALWMAALTKADKKTALEIEMYLETLKKDAPIVDVRAVVDGGGAAAEVAKYVSKSADLLTLHLDQLAEWLEAVRGARLWVAAGCLKTAHEENLDLIHEAENGSAELCPVCGARLQLVDWIFSSGEYSPAPAPLNWWEKRRE